MKQIEEKRVTVIGGGLSGSEAAWQLAERGVAVTLYEMRSQQSTGAHKSDLLAELVCSNSLGSSLPDRATGVLQNELRRMGSLLLSCAEQCRVPAGGALAVGREAFAERVTEAVSRHPNITVVREEVKEIPKTGPTVLATGPLTSERMAQSLAAFTGDEHLFFFDALAPVVEEDSINMDTAFRASRYGRGTTEDGDYINCPLNREEYGAFVDALLEAECIELKSFEACIRENGVRAGLHRFFEGCLPIEIIASRGRDALAFGPMRPVGLTDPRTGRRAHAVLQLRQDNLAGSLYNLVGFQTNLREGEQRRVFRMIPGLEQAEFVRYGQMHRNTFVCSPRVLQPTLQTKAREDLFLCGQLIGIEGYVGNMASGLLAGWNAARVIQGAEPVTLPKTSMLGCLIHYITHAHPEAFQPMKANFGIMPPLTTTQRLGKRQRAAAYAARAMDALERSLAETNLTVVR
jgi:methylenetetrahydrofolate--tRNA-(uracil-5-)-methyltransferase